MEKTKERNTNLGKEFLNVAVSWRGNLGLHEILNELPHVHIINQIENRWLLRGCDKGIRMMAFFEAILKGMVQMYSHIFVNKVYMMNHVDHLLHILQIYHYIMIIIIYVVDIIILANDMDIINELKCSLKHKFEMTDFGELHYFLGVHLKWIGERVLLSCINRITFKAFWSDSA